MRNLRPSLRLAELLTAASLLFPLSASTHGQSVSPLGARGFTVIPPPQSVKLGAQDFPFGNDRRLELAPDVPTSDIAVQTLKEGLQSRFGVTVREGGRGGAAGTLRLEIEPQAVPVGEATDRERGVLAQQAYRLLLAPGRVQITANAAPGLFYGVQTLAGCGKIRFC